MDDNSRDNVCVQILMLQVYKVVFICVTLCYQLLLLEDNAYNEQHKTVQTVQWWYIAYGLVLCNANF